MGFSRQQNHFVDFIFTLSLFCVFTFSAFLVVVLGANVYENMVERTQENDTSRTALIYLAEKLRQNDTADAISMGTLEGTPALLLERDYEGTAYVTYIYAYEGELKEYFTRKENPVSVGDGQTILAITDFQMEQEGELYHFSTSTESGQTLSLYLNPKCEQ